MSELGIFYPNVPSGGEKRVYSGTLENPFGNASADEVLSVANALYSGNAIGQINIAITSPMSGNFIGLFTSGVYTTNLWFGGANNSKVGDDYFAVNFGCTADTDGSNVKYDNVSTYLISVQAGQFVDLTQYINKNDETTLTIYGTFE